MRIVTKIFLGLFAALLVVIGAGVGIGWIISAPISETIEAKVQGAAHYRDGKFVNIEPQAGTEITLGALKEAVSSHERTNPVGEIPVVAIEPERLSTAPKPGLRMAWFGHAGVLIEIDGQRILTDPVFSDRASPVGFAGPLRFHPTPIALEKLTGIDAVIVTHNHYDHLDKATVRHLAGQGTRFFVPLGNKATLLAWDVPDAQVEELNWWDEATLGSVKVVATPSRHYSNRGIFDFKETLWASWSLVGPQNRVFVSGDTGYSKLFSEVGTRLGPFDATIIKIGAYGPGQSWKDVHMTPEQSMQVHNDVGGKQMLPVHWGTFNLAYHPWDEPIIRSQVAAEENGVRLLTPKIGEFVEPGDDLKFSNWWESVD